MPVPVPEKGGPEEVSNEDREEEEERVHDCELDQLLAEHGLPAQLPQRHLRFEPAYELGLNCSLISHENKVYDTSVGNHKD
jgi:hypothetical protein